MSQVCSTGTSRRIWLTSPPISPDQQATAARLVSAEFLGEVSSFGRFGNRLHTFVLSLGSLFAIAHQRPTQSEPEITHFAVDLGQQELSERRPFLLGGGS